MLVVAFYTGMSELRGVVNVTVHSGLVNPILGPGEIRGVVDVLITQLQLIGFILDRFIVKPGLEQGLPKDVRDVMREKISERLRIARQLWPDSESFKA